MTTPTPEQRADIRRLQAKWDPEHDDCHELALELLEALEVAEAALARVEA